MTLKIIEWASIARPLQKGFYVVELIADDGDDVWDTWVKTEYWDGSKWSTCQDVNRFSTERFSYKVDPHNFRLER